MKVTLLNSFKLTLQVVTVLFVCCYYLVAPTAAAAQISYSSPYGDQMNPSTLPGGSTYSNSPVATSQQSANSVAQTTTGQQMPNTNVRMKSFSTVDLYIYQNYSISCIHNVSCISIDSPSRAPRNPCHTVTITM